MYASGYYVKNNKKADQENKIATSRLIFSPGVKDVRNCYYFKVHEDEIKQHQKEVLKYYNMTNNNEILTMEELDKLDEQERSFITDKVLISSHLVIIKIIEAYEQDKANLKRLAKLKELAEENFDKVELELEEELKKAKERFIEWRIGTIYPELNPTVYKVDETRIRYGSPAHTLIKRG